MPTKSIQSKQDAFVTTQEATPPPVIIPNMIYNPDPRGRAKASSTQDAVAVRTRPAFGATQITQMEKRKAFPVIGKTNDGQWWQLLVKGIPGWVSASSVKRWNVDNVPVTYIPDGGVPASQEIYFLFVLGQHRDNLKKKSNLLNANRAFLHATTWVEKQRILIPSDKRDPEYMTPAEGGVGMLERQIRDQDPHFNRLRGAMFLFFIGGLLAGLALPPGGIGAVLAMLAAVMPLGLWLLTIYYSQGMLHNRYHTKSQRQAVQMRNYATIAAGVAATAAAVSVAANSNKPRKPGEKSTVAKLGTILKEAAPLIEKAAPAIGAAGTVYLGKKALENRQEGEMIEAQSVPLVPLHTFISYRRLDSQKEAEWLYDQLSAEFAPGSIFLDREEIDAGNDFRSELLENLGQAKVVVVLIGSKWLSEIKRRANQVDYVKEEIQYALNNRITVIPVLLHTMEEQVMMPSEDDLPPEIALLAYRHAFELSPTNRDIGTLVERIKQELGKHVLIRGDY